MMTYILKLAKNTKGAMDKILVTLLLVVIGVGLVVGLNTWMSDEMDTVKDAAGSKITEVVGETTGE
ncbi:hypothetical protein [Arcobacter sp. FWKO B]|uniref:hypothetical protein n=1 Tax=Arcobacter sp. FWKO B TaxID=2593672 RepID=UPI0018A45AC9|nr:hypothetical protein [Arcobacter sp. FWKO B]QOG12546.1 hypothetical protein FWKOB_07440 [Arcobacter sp. FWKO B]